MLLKNNIKEIKSIIKNDENFLCSEEECYCYAQDATNMQSNEISPDIVVFVETIEEVQNLLRYANQHKIPVVSRGAGTNMVGACTCPKGGIVLNFSKMNKILDFNPVNMTVKVQPGVIIGDLKNFVEEKGLYYPPDPSNYKVSTIGGSIAQSSGGAKSFKYGTTKDYILSLTVVLADGTLMKLGSGMLKDAVGYHLNQLIVGSEGTLAIVVEAELKLIPKPDFSGLIIGYFDDFEDSINCVNSVVVSNIYPSTIEFMDNNTIKTVERFKHCGLDTTKDALLLIEVEGNEKSVKEDLNKVFDVVSQNNASLIKVSTEKNEMEEIWSARRASFAASAQLAPNVVSDDIIVPRKNLVEMVKGCKRICNKYNLNLCMVGHAGDGNIHPQIALDLSNDIEFKNYQKAKSEMYKLAKALDGTVSAEHGVGVEKMNYIVHFLDTNSIECMKRIKMLFDPNNILNPDKIFKI